MKSMNDDDKNSDLFVQRYTMHTSLPIQFYDLSFKLLNNYVGSSSWLPEKQSLNEVKVGKHGTFLDQFFLKMPKVY